MSHIEKEKLLFHSALVLSETDNLKVDFERCKIENRLGFFDLDFSSNFRSAKTWKQDYLAKISIAILRVKYYLDYRIKIIFVIFYIINLHGYFRALLTLNI